MKNFFISYNCHDKQWAEWIAWTLEEAGKTVIVEAWDFQPGGNFVLYMNRAIKEAKQTIAVLSQHFLEANYTQSEWAAAFAQDPQGTQRKLIPVKVSECQPEGVLAQIVYVDLVGVTETEAKQRLLNGLKKRAAPDKRPSFPGAVVPKSERTEPEPVAFPGVKTTVPPTPLTRRLVLTRRQLLGLGLVGVGVGSVLLVKAFQPRLTTLQTFEFDVITVNAQGKEVKRQRGKAQSFTEDLVNKVGLEMVSIPGDSFLMGSPAEEGKNSEKPQHTVIVQQFLMGKYAVTQAQWQAVAGLPKLKYDLQPDPSKFKGAKRPVENVTWQEAVEFCDRLSRKTGREYRLPSEAEWEYACRAGTTTPFYFGEMLTTDLANYDLSREGTTDVGSFPPNAFGLYDMHGNVYEWCVDHWHDNYQDAPTNGSAWVENDYFKSRSLRGGSWDNDQWHCRSASRFSNTPGFRYNLVGFRVICSVS